MRNLQDPRYKNLWIKKERIVCRAKEISRKIQYANVSSIKQNKDILYTNYKLTDQEKNKVKQSISINDWWLLCWKSYWSDPLPISSKNKWESKYE